MTSVFLGVPLSVARGVLDLPAVFRMEDTMSFFCPWQDAQFETCRRTAETPCLPGKPGCVLFGKVEFVRDHPGWNSTSQDTTPVPEANGRILRRTAAQEAPESTEPPEESASRTGLLSRLGAFPSLLRGDLQAIPPETKVGLWSAAQVVHHLADVHSAGLARVRRALTEVEPKVEAYDHESWARLEDAGRPDLVPASLALLDGTHARWVALLASLSEAGWSRAYRPTGSRRRVTVEADLLWHVEHGDRHRRALLEAIRTSMAS